MHTNLNQIVARNVAEAMKAAGENKSSLARATGIHRTKLHNRLTGNFDWNMSELEAIATRFNTTPAELMAARAA